MLLGGHGVPTKSHTGVSKKQVDWPECFFGGIDEMNVAGFGSDIGNHLDRTGQLVPDRSKAVTIRENHIGSSRMEAPGEGCSDPASGSCDNDVLT